MKKQEILNVVSSALDGSTLEAKTKGKNNKWVLQQKGLVFDFDNLDYRVAPVKLKRVYVKEILKDGLACIGKKFFSSVYIRPTGEGDVFPVEIAFVGKGVVIDDDDTYYDDQDRYLFVKE